MQQICTYYSKKEVILSTLYIFLCIMLLIFSANNCAIITKAGLYIGTHSLDKNPLYSCIFLEKIGPVVYFLLTC